MAKCFQFPRGILQICKDSQELFSVAAERFVSIAKESVAMHGGYQVALSGGSTPTTLYALLSNNTYSHRIPWDKTHLFWGDERCVSHQSHDSNYHMAKDALLSKIPIPSENVHPTIGQDQDPQQAAAQYERTICSAFNLKTGENPGFDLILLGLGTDGHTASLFPGTLALSETSKIVVANYVDNLKAYRITLTLPVINNARNVIFLVSGTSKQDILLRVLSAPNTVLPATLISPANGNLEWIVDAEAAAGLDLKTLHCLQ